MSGRRAAIHGGMWTVFLSLLGLSGCPFANHVDRRPGTPLGPDICDSRHLAFARSPLLPSPAPSGIRTAGWTTPAQLLVAPSSGGSPVPAANISSVSVSIVAEDTPPGTATRVSVVRVAIDGSLRPGFTLGYNNAGISVYVELLTSGTEVEEIRMQDLLVADPNDGTTFDYNSTSGAQPLVLFNAVDEARIELRYSRDSVLCPRN